MWWGAGGWLAGERKKASHRTFPAGLRPSSLSEQEVVYHVVWCGVPR